jgi:hypothetical protein
MEQPMHPVPSPLLTIRAAYIELGRRVTVALQHWYHTDEAITAKLSVMGRFQDHRLKFDIGYQVMAQEQPRANPRPKASRFRAVAHAYQAQSHRL